MIYIRQQGRMTLADDVDLEVFIMAKDELSGADIKAICTESGLLALRERRMKVRTACLPLCQSQYLRAKFWSMLLLGPRFDMILLYFLST